MSKKPKPSAVAAPATEPLPQGEAPQAAPLAPEASATPADAPVSDVAPLIAPEAIQAAPIVADAANTSLDPGPAPADPTGAGEEPVSQEGAADDGDADETAGDELLDPADYGLTVDPDGLVSLTMLTGLSGPEISLSPGDPHRADVQEACRLARAKFAVQGAAKA